MTAREELERWAAFHISGVEVMNFDHLLGAALSAARKGMLREAATEIRGQRWSADDEPGALAAADFIDPDKT